MLNMYKSGILGSKKVNMVKSGQLRANVPK